MNDESRDILQMFFFSKRPPRTTADRLEISHFSFPPQFKEKNKDKEENRGDSSLPLMNEIYDPCLMRDEDSRGTRREDPPTPCKLLPLPSPRRPGGSETDHFLNHS